MTIAGIICEYNPFHSGHERHISVTKQSREFVVCAMSGALVQRGGVAALDKWTRAKTALLCGADAVFELPAMFASRSAADFARGGVGLLADLGCGALSFGSEVDDLDALKACARADFARSAGVKEALSQGKSYPRAVYESVSDAKIREILRLPNATLAAEYIRNIYAQGRDMGIIAVKRGSAHDGEGFERGASSSAMREAIFAGDMESALANAPEAIRPILESAVYAKFESIGALVLHMIRSAPLDALAGIADMSEGLESRLKKAAWRASSLEGMFALAKTKRYPLARIRRAAMHCALGLTKEMCQRYPLPPYARLLGFRKDSQPLISHIKRTARIPVITRAARSDMHPCLALDIAAQDLFDLCAGRVPGGDFTRPPVIV